MLGLIVTMDKPTSEKVVRRRSYLSDIAGNSGGGVSHSRGILNLDIPSMHSKGEEEARQTSYR